MDPEAYEENKKIIEALGYIFPGGVGDLNVIAEIPVTELNQEMPIPRGGEHYGLRVSDIQNGEPPEGIFVEYKVYVKGDPAALAITYIRKYPSRSSTRNSVWAVFGYVNGREAKAGTLTLYNTYEQFRWVDGGHVSTLPLGFPPVYTQTQTQRSEEVSSRTLDDHWIRAIQRERTWRRSGGGRRRKTRHRRRKTRRRKTRRSRR